MSNPTPLRHRRLSRWLAALLIASALAALYGRYLLRPRDFFVGDLVSFYQPMRHYVAGCLAEGRLPRWTPAIFAGTPQLADAQLAIFYPPTWLHLVVPFPLSELLLLLGHLLLGGLGVLFLARRLGLGGAPGLFAALGYALCGFFVSHLVHPNFVHSAAWVPWLLGGLHGVVAGPGRRVEAAGVALVTALGLLAGGVQIAYVGVGLAAVLTLGWVIALPGLDHRGRIVGGALAFGALLLGAALAAVQLLPTAELAPLSIREGGVTLELARSYRLAARQGLGLVVPFPFGLAERTPVVWSQPFHESFAYFGAASLPLALTALFGASWARRPAGEPLAAPWRLALPRWILAASALLALLGAMGPEAPVDVHRWLFQWLPGFDRFRAPGRLLYLVATCTLLLSAYGLHDLLAGDEARRARARWLHLGFTLLAVGAALAVGLLASGAAGPLPEATAALARRSALGAAAVVLGVWVLLAGGARYRVAPAWVGAGVVAIQLLDLLTVGRAVVAARQGPEGADLERLAHRPPAEIGADPRRAHHEHRILFRPDSYFMLQNAGLLHGYDNLRSYSPVMLRRTYDLLHLADRGRFPTWTRLPVDHNLIAVRGLGSPVLRLLGVRHVLGHDRPRAAPGQRADLRWRVTTLAGALPRAFVVHRTRLAPRREDRERWLLRLDPGQEALVESAAARIPGGGDPRASFPVGGDPEAATGERTSLARVTRRDRCAGDAAIQVMASRPGLLIFTESWHPGWQATVNGRSAPVHRVNHGLVGVGIPRAGPSEVRLRFRPRSLVRGVWISSLAAAALVALVLVPWGLAWGRRRSRPGGARTAEIPGAGNSGASGAS